MYHQTEVPPSQELSQGQDSQPIFVPTTHRVDCSVKGGVKSSASDRIPLTTPGAEPPRDVRDSGSARSHSTPRN